MKLLQVMKPPERKFIPLMSWDISTEMINHSEKYEELPIGGFHKQSLIDYPGLLSAVLFTQGCNFKCIYCHNPNLIPIKKNSGSLLNNHEILTWIDKHKSLLDAVCITGGEPTLHKSLPVFIKRLKTLDLKIKLDTNGSNPVMLRQLISDGLIDFVAMDVKTELNAKKYNELTGCHAGQDMVSKVSQSIQILEQSKNINYEFRITLLNNYHTDKGLKELIEKLHGSIVLQNFRPVSGVTPLKLNAYKNIEGLESLFKFKHIKFRGY